MPSLSDNDILQLVADLERRVDAFRSAENRRESVRRLFWTLAGIVVAGSLCIVGEAVGHSSTSIRTGLAAVLTSGAVLALGWTSIPFLRAAGMVQAEDRLSVTRRLGQRFEILRDRLTNALQLGRPAPDSSWVSNELANEFIRSVHSTVGRLDLLAALDTKGTRIAFRAMLFSAVGTVLLFVAFPESLFDAARRIVNFSRSYVPPPVYVLTLSPGTVEVVKGSPVDVRVEVRTPAGEPVQELLNVTLQHRVNGQDTYDHTPLIRDSSGRYGASLGPVRLTTSYFAVSGPVASEVCTLAVLDRPVISSLRLRIEPPAYSRLPERTQEEFAGSITALPGTRVTISGEAQKPILSGALLFGDSTIVPLTVSGARFSGSFGVRSAGTYHLSLTDESGLTNAAPVRYAITVLPDGVPQVRIVDPGRNLDVAGSERLSLAVQANDDYGIASLRIAYRLSHSRYEQPQTGYATFAVPIPTRDRLDVLATAAWDLSALHLAPEDVIEYYAEASDNNTITGPGISRSAVYTLRLPSLEEVFTDLDTGHDDNLEQMSAALEEAKRLKEELTKISDDFKKNKDFDWQKQQQTGAMAAKAAEVQKKMEEVRQNIEAMTQQMQQQQVLSPKTLEKYLELQDLFKEMDTHELQQALQKMQQGMQNVDREQMRQALEKAQFSEDRFRESIERTINLLKRIQIEQKLDEVRTRAQDLARRQEEVRAASGDSTGSAQENARKQEELSRDEERLEKEAQSLQEKMDEFFAEMPADKMAALNASLQERKLSQKMTQAARQLSLGRTSDAQQEQQEAAQALQEFAEQMQALQKEMLEDQARAMTQALRRTTTDLLELSRRQEALKNRSQSAGSNSPELRQNAQEQQRIIQDLSNILSALGQLAQKSFVVTPGMGKALGEAMNGMQSAMRDLDVRNGAQAAQDQTGAMASLNRAAQQVQSALQAMQQGQGGMPGGMGLMQQLQMLAGQQLSVNMNTQEGNSGDAMRRAADAARLSQEQDAVRKSLEQLNREAQSSADGRRILGDLQKIADEMREVVRNLEQSGAQPETIRRQERILSRLLDASRSMQERDYEQKRRATTALPVNRQRPGPLDPNALDGRSRLREDLLRALEQGYARDYQELIRKYFEALEQQEAVTGGR